MNMGFYERCRYWIIVQVVAFVVCCVGNASGSTIDIVQGCVGSRLDLHCPSMKVIRKIKVEQGVSGCKRDACCISEAGCPKTPSEQHVTLVRQSCQDRQNCTFEKIQPIDATPCSSGWWLWKTTIDGHAFERIIYSCMEKMVTPTNGTNTELDNETSIEKEDNEVNSTEAEGKAKLPVVMVSLILVILVAIVGLVVFMHRRRKLFAQVKVCDPVAMTKIGNHRNETDVNANEDHGATIYSCVGLADEADYTPTKDDPIVYSEVEQRKLVWKDGQGRDCLATDKAKAAVEARPTGPDIYAVVNKPSKAPATSSAARTDQMGEKGFVKKDDCSTEQIYSLASNVSEDIYANEPALQSTGLMTGTISKTPMPQLEVGQTVIENDLYCH